MIPECSGGRGPGKLWKAKPVKKLEGHGTDSDFLNKIEKSSVDFRPS